MLINNLSLSHFRNYKKEYFVFNPYINILIGDNAQGKTNVLEAIAMLSSCQSFKTHNNSEMIYFNEDFSIIEGEVLSNNKPLDMKIVLSKKGKKASINQKEIKRLSEYIGYLNVILFLPEDLNLVKGSPKGRRNLLDQEISKISPIYMFNLSKYNKLLKERNMYLKTLKKSHKKADMYLDVLSEQMATLQVDLIKRRIEFIELLNMISAKFYNYISKDETLEMKYISKYKEITYDEILNMYKNNYERDIAHMVTLDGLHKDDFKMTLNLKDAQLYASQGQQRSIVLAIKMALLEIVKKEIGEYPILLLDDVLSELDDMRKDKLLNLIDEKVQTFITTTSVDGIMHDTIKKAHKINIKSGGIVNG